MKIVVDKGWESILGPWLAEKTDGSYIPRRGSYIGLADTDTRAIAGVCHFSDCNGASVLMHCAGEGRKWLNREFLWYSFYYPFRQLGVKKVISPVESNNLDCIHFIENLGFNLEATLRDCSPKGDLLLYTLAEEQCKWLRLKEKISGKAESSSNS